VIQTDFGYDFLAKYGAEEIAKVKFPLFCVLCGFWPLFLFFDANQQSTASLKGVSLGMLER
jgi:hypothetical protein